MSLDQKVMSIIQSNVEGKCFISPSTQLRTELNLDSFGTLMVINALEESLSIHLQEEDFRPLNTVADVVTLLKGKYQCQ
jgi:acyl carrier protein